MPALPPVLHARSGGVPARARHVCRRRSSPWRRSPRRRRSRSDLPSWVLPGALIVMALGLPVILFTGYVQSVARRALIATPALTPGGGQVPHGTMATIALKASPHVSWKRTTRGGVFALGGVRRADHRVHGDARVRHRTRWLVVRRGQAQSARRGARVGLRREPRRLERRQRRRGRRAREPRRVAVAHAVQSGERRRGAETHAAAADVASSTSRSRDSSRCAKA